MKDKRERTEKELELKIAKLKGAVLTLSGVVCDLISSANNYTQKRKEDMQKFIKEIGE